MKNISQITATQRAAFVAGWEQEHALTHELDKHVALDPVELDQMISIAATREITPGMNVDQCKAAGQRLYLRMVSTCVEAEVNQQLQAAGEEIARQNAQQLAPAASSEVIALKGNLLAECDITISAENIDKIVEKLEMQDQRGADRYEYNITHLTPVGREMLLDLIDEMEQRWAYERVEQVCEYAGV